MENNYKNLVEKFTDGIIETNCLQTYNPNGADTFSCPFCSGYQYSHKNEHLYLCDIDHDDNCLYLSAIEYQKSLPVVPDEYILCAAIDYYGFIISGFRHKDCAKILDKISLNDNDLYPRGFLTSKNRFVDRKEAWKIALANNQIKYGLAASDRGEDSILISENLYMLENE